jgi:cupin fold WbuC family metalloprotein
VSGRPQAGLFPEEAGVRFLDGGVLDALSAEARSRPRRRANGNLHAMEDPVHRLLNAVEPGTYIRPHRHLHPPKDETYVIVRGALGLVLFDASGAAVATRRLAIAAGDAFGVDIPAGVFHTVVALEEGTVFFEVKAGPYVPSAGDDVPAWAPAEGEPAAAAYEARLRALFA